MHILYLHQYFATPNAQTGTRSYSFARRWVAAGHRVTMLTTTAMLTDEDLGTHRRKFIMHANIEGIHVVALHIRYSQEMGYLRRIGSFLWFMKFASWYVVFKPGIDIVYATSTPLTVGVPALKGKWLRRRRYVFEVRDPWPAVPIEMGIIKNSILIRLLRWLERSIYRNACAIISATDGMTELIKKVAPADKKIATIPHGTNTEMFSPDVDGSKVRHERGWDHKFVFTHTGTMGKVNGLDLIVRAANHFREDPDMLFVLLGEGKEKASLIEQRDKLGLTNLQIVDGITKKEIPGVLAATDVCLMIITNEPVLEHNCANKFFDYLSSGKPVLLNYSGWQRKVLESAEAGLGCTLGDENEFFEKLTTLKSDSTRREWMSKNARKLALEKFNRNDLADVALKVISDCA